MNDLRRPLRKALRLKGYDYRKPGLYFITLCIRGRPHLFGEIKDGTMAMNAAGKMVEQTWISIPERFPTVALDEWIVMPNHLHGIVALAAHDIPPNSMGPAIPPALGLLIGAFKSLSTNSYIRGVRDCGWTPFVGHLWQRNYYEHVVRDESTLHASASTSGKTHAAGSKIQKMQR